MFFAIFKWKGEEINENDLSDLPGNRNRADRKQRDWLFSGAGGPRNRSRKDPIVSHDRHREK